MLAPVDTNASSLPIAIVGGGLTGLAAAYRLATLGRRVRLFEAAPRVGGAVRSDRDGAWLIEAGPNSLQENSVALTTLLHELGLDGEKCYANAAARNRYILRNGRPCAAPSSPPGLLTSPLFSAGAKLHLLRELFHRRRHRTDDLSLAAFIGEHFGRELVDYGLDPFVSGVYAGDPEALSARHSFPSLWAAEQSHGSIIRAQIAAAKAKRARGETAGPPRILSFREGLETLPRALAASLPAGSIETDARVERIVPGSPWRIGWTRGDERHTEACAAVIACLPAAGLASLRLGHDDERPLAPLAEIPSPPVCSLFLGYRRKQVAHPLDGFGMLVPSLEKRKVLGVLFSSSLFPDRAPEDHVALTVMVGGIRQPDLARLPLAELLPIVRRELAELLGVDGEPVLVRHTLWPRAIPQYVIGHDRHLDLISRTEEAHPGLHIAGQVRDGIAMSACLAAGRHHAERAADFQR
jgi:oxygen-dependent protoporphyrinogen oxidase